MEVWLGLIEDHLAGEKWLGVVAEKSLDLMTALSLELLWHVKHDLKSRG